jgi:hypothetical protein
MNKAYLILLFISTIVSNINAQNFSKDLNELAGLMQGSFSSGDQSKIDSGYFDIRLEIKRIWPERTDGIWLYVEQAAARSLDKPYRQRIYRLTETGYNLFESEVFEIEEPLRFAGEWKKKRPFATNGTEILMPRQGCSVHLKKIGKKTYSGSTVDKECLSDWRGAKYATSIVTITKKGMITWDRGFDENGSFLWGAEKAGYHFKKK